MKKGLAILSIFAFVGLSGCCCIQKDFVRAIDGHTQLILPEYKEYVAKDQNLSEDTKRIRTQSADELQKLIDEAKKEK